MRGLAPFWIDPNDTDLRFPDIDLALTEPDGLLAVGGDLRPARLEIAYRSGIFPWYNHDQPILWWSPNPRSVLFPHKLHLSKSLQKLLKKNPYDISCDRAFAAVIDGCSQPRADGPGTWITTEMKRAYITMHRLGHAHSVEAWHHGKLVGGLYGMAFGKVFFGESMFTIMPNASKVAFAILVRQLIEWDYKLVDCQISSEHLNRFGAQSIPREQFKTLLDQYCRGDDAAAGATANANTTWDLFIAARR